MATITVQELGPHGEGFANVSFTSLTEASNDFANDGQTILLMKNGDAASQNIVITAIDDPYGRGLGTEDLTITGSATGEVAMSGFLSTSLFGGTVNFTVSIADGDVEVAAVRLRR